jgi:hypothetical protein
MPYVLNVTEPKEYHKSKEKKKLQNKRIPFLRLRLSIQIVDIKQEAEAHFAHNHMSK